MKINTRLPEQGGSPEKSQEAKFSGVGVRRAFSGHTELLGHLGSQTPPPPPPPRCFPPSFGRPGSVWFLRTKRKAVWGAGPEAPGKAIADSCWPCNKHTLALNLGADGDTLHGVEGLFSCGKKGLCLQRPQFPYFGLWQNGNFEGAPGAGELVSMSQVKPQKKRGFCIGGHGSSSQGPLSRPRVPSAQCLKM